MPFDPSYYSHKVGHGGLRYEIGLLVSSGHIVLVNGPFPCGAFASVIIFRQGLKGKLLPAERVITDKGYPDRKCSSKLLGLLHEVI